MPFLAPPRPFCQRLTPLRVVLQSRPTSRPASSTTSALPPSPSPPRPSLPLLTPPHPSQHPHTRTHHAASPPPPPPPPPPYVHVPDHCPHRSQQPISICHLLACRALTRLQFGWHVSTIHGAVLTLTAVRSHAQIGAAHHPLPSLRRTRNSNSIHQPRCFA